jgi:hypothetical protein
VPTEDEVDSLLDQGKKVFGFSMDQIDVIAPLIARAIAARA